MFIHEKGYDMGRPRETVAADWKKSAELTRQVMHMLIPLLGNCSEPSWDVKMSPFRVQLCMANTCHPFIWHRWRFILQFSFTAQTGIRKTSVFYMLKEQDITSNQSLHFVLSIHMLLQKCVSLVRVHMYTKPKDQTPKRWPGQESPFRMLNCEIDSSQHLAWSSLRLPQLLFHQNLLFGEFQSS